MVIEEWISYTPSVERKAHAKRCLSVLKTLVLFWLRHDHVPGSPCVYISCSGEPGNEATHIQLPSWFNSFHSYRFHSWEAVRLVMNTDNLPWHRQQHIPLANLPAVRLGSGLKGLCKHSRTSWIYTCTTEHLQCTADYKEDNGALDGLPARLFRLCLR